VAEYVYTQTNKYDAHTAHSKNNEGDESLEEADWIDCRKVITLMNWYA
jgi:hypothetical protein